jgi:hypothetical protein
VTHSSRSADSTSGENFEANPAALLLKLLAHNLPRRCVDEHLRGEGREVHAQSLPASWGKQ